MTGWHCVPCMLGQHATCADTRAAITVRALDGQALRVETCACTHQPTRDRRTPQPVGTRYVAT